MMFQTHRQLCLSQFAAFLVALCLPFAAPPANAQPILFVANSGNSTVGEYNATTGATINTTFINNGQGLSSPVGLVLDGSNHLFVANFSGNTVGQYNATTGATVNATFVNAS